MEVETEGRLLRERMRAWMVDWWGERCPDVEPTCCLCLAWQAFDYLFDNLDSEEAEKSSKPI